MKFGAVQSNSRRAVVAALVAFGPCAGCGPAGRTAAHVGNDVAHIPRPRVHVPVPHANGAEVDEASVVERQAGILSPLDDIGADDLKGTCDLSLIEEDEELRYSDLIRQAVAAGICGV